MEFTCIDEIASSSLNNRFTFILTLLSFKFNIRFLINYTLKNTVTSSLNNFYNSVNWLEREIWDLFGIVFNSHPDLRRILTDYGFFGYPLRKDFPITGFIEVRYNELHKRLVFMELSLVQEFRNMELINPWLDT